MSTSPLSQTRRRSLMMLAVAVITALLSTGTTAAVASASTRAPAPAAAAHSLLKNKPKPKHKKKHKPKPKPKPKPKVTTTTAAPTPTTNEKPPSGNYNISEAGSTLLEPLFQLWAQSYSKQYPNVNVSAAGGGSGAGVSGAASGTVNIGGSDAYLSSSQVSATPGLMNIALAISSQLIVTNITDMANGAHINLSGQVLSLIYQGKITYWDDSRIQSINPGVNLPHQQIVALHRSDSSGDTFIFTSYLSAADPSGWGSSVSYGTSVSFPSISNALGESGNGGMVSGCKSTPGCIAYIGISYKSQIQSDNLQIDAISNASGNYEQATASTVTAEAQAVEKQTPADETLSMVYDSAADGYPIVNYEYAIVQQHQSSAGEAAAIRAFLDWAIDPGAGSNNSFLSQVNFIPLTQAVQALSVAQINKIGS
jgi:phosphate transport system substrate-binding protein